MMKSNEQEAIELLIATGRYKIIKKYEPVEQYNEPNQSADIKLGIFLDTETNGMDPDENKVIELAMVPFEFDSYGNIYRLLPAYNAFQDPGEPIPALITQITGITDEMVKGQSIDFEQVKSLLSDAVIVIAHNARFDRPFCELMLKDFENIAWGCSIADVNWNAEGFEGVKLEYLAYKYGFFFEGHRATIDCLAGIELLSKSLPNSGTLVLKQLLDNARRTDVRLWADKAPFEMKDELKKRGYRWSPGGAGKRKAWYRDLPEDMLDEEMLYLNEHIYHRAVGVLPTDRFNAKVRYSRRV